MSNNSQQAAQPTVQQLLEEAVRAVEVSHLAVEKSAAITAEREKTAAQIKEQAPTIADSLIRSGYIYPNERQAAIESIGDHCKLASLLQSVLQHANTGPGPLSVGQEVASTTTKKASNAKPIEYGSNAADLAYREALNGSAH
jgi:hypothetical protein